MRLNLRSSISVLAVAFGLFGGLAKAQLTGIKTIPGDYATMALAFTDLNTLGVGTGGVTFNVAAGYTETGSLTLTMSTNPPNASKPVVFQKSGAGANPLITAGVGTGTLDGIIKLDGVDYVTFNGIDLQESAANVTSTTQMEWGYALLKSAATNGAQYNTIKNSTVTLNQANTGSVCIYIGNHTTASGTALTVSAFSGTSSYNKFHNNTVQNSVMGYSISGYASAAPFDMYDQGNEIGTDGVSTRRNQILQYGNAGTAAHGITATNQNGIKIFRTYINNTGGLTSTGVLNGINLITGTNSNVDVYNDTITLVSNATTSNVVGINTNMGATGAGNTVNIYNNVITNCTYNTATTGVFRGIWNSPTATYQNIHHNTISNNTQAGTGDFAAIYSSGSSATLILNVNINDNIISNNTKTGAGGAFYCIFASGTSNTVQAFNNTMSTNSATATSGNVYGYYNFAFGLNEIIHDNTITGLSGGSGETIGLVVKTGSGPTNKDVYNNTVSAVTGNAAGFSVGGIGVTYGTICNVYNNRVFNITNNTTTGISPAAFGLDFGPFNNLQMSVHNNFISDIKAPSASNLNAVNGLWFEGTVQTTARVYYNTVYIAATSTGVDFGTAAASFLTAAAPSSVDIRNNIFVDNSTPNGTGVARAMLRSSTTIANYSTLSGSNCLYAGVPSATHLIYSDGTNFLQTLQAFRNFVTPREQASFSEVPPFVSIGTNDLHLLGGIPTQCESGGRPVSITTDYDAVARSVTFPDVGADEFSGNFSDTAPPDIRYTSLTNSAVGANRVLTNFAAITDNSGINNTIGTRPRIYYKRSTDSNAFNTNNSATNGWKFTEATNATSPFSFTIDYSLLNGGTGVVAGDVIQYFITAQDLFTTPRVGRNSGAFSVEPTSVALTGTAFPLTSTINQYTIVAGALSGVIPVGPAEIITSLTNAGGMFDLINQGTVSGNITLSVTGDLTAETGAIALNEWAEQGVGGYTITLAPSAGVVRTISGSSAATSLVLLNGADRFIIDGRFGGSGVFLRLRNTSNSAPTIGFQNDAQNNIVRFAIIESGNTSIAATAAGAVFIGSTTGANGNDNNTITFCEIRDRSDVAGTPAMSVHSTGNSTTTLGAYNDNCVISNNSIHDWFLLNNGNQYAVNILTGCNAFTISGNSIYQTATRTNTVAGAVTRAININNTSTVTANGGFIITDNFIGGTAPLATGTDMTITVSGAGVTQTFTGISVISGLVPNSIQNNVIRKIDFTTNAFAANTTVAAGIFASNGVHNIGTVTGNIIGGNTGNDLFRVTVNSGGVGSSFFAGIAGSTVNGSYTISNNVIGGITFAGTTTGAFIPQYIQAQGTPVSTVVINNNLVGSTTTANSNRVTTTTPPSIAFGIRGLLTSGANVTISGNTIQNVSDASTATNSADYGILAISAAGGKGVYTITNNIIRDFTSNTGPAAPALACMGISLQGMSGNNHVVSGNTINNVNLANTGAVSGYAIGIQTQGSSFGGTMSKNKIYDIRNSGTGTAPGIGGIYVSAGDGWTVSNNMISLSNNAVTAAMTMFGIADFSTNGVMNYYFNTIYIGGTAAAGASNSYAFGRGSTSIIAFRNNLLYNERTGGTGFHYAIGNNGGSPGTNWNGGASDNNYFINADATHVGEWGTAVATTMAGWRTSSGTDAATRSSLNTALTSASLFVSTSGGNLKINPAYYLTPSFLESRGVAAGGITTDYEGDARPGPAGSINGGATAPDIGADEFDGTPGLYDIADFALFAPAISGCHGATDPVTITIMNTGNVAVDFSVTPLTLNASVTGPNPMVFTPVVLSSGTLAVGATQNVVVSASYDMTLAGTYTFSSNLTMSFDDNSVNNTLTPVAIIVSGGTAGAVPATICAGFSTTLTVSGYTNGGTIQWQDSTAGGAWADIVGATSNTLVVSPTVTTWYHAVNCGLQLSTLVMVTVNPNPVVDLGPDTLTCTAAIVFDAGNPGSTYLWSTTASTQTESVSSPGTYSVIVTDVNGCVGYDTVVVALAPDPVVDLGPDTSLCVGTIVFDAGNPGASYLWSTTATTQTESATSPGTLYVDVTDNHGCIGSDTVVVSAGVVPVVDLGADSVQCGGTIDLDAGNPGASYLWSTSAGTQVITASTSGTYYVDVTNAGLGCTASDTVVLTINAIPVVDLGADTVQCGGTVDLDAGNPGASYLWSTSAGTQVITVSTSGTYSVEVSTGAGAGCTVSDTITVTINSIPAVSFGFATDTVCLDSLPVTLTGGSPSGGVYSGPGVSGGSFDPSAAGAGLHTITYTYTDGLGCFDSATDLIFVDSCLTGISGPAFGMSMSLYPNPNSGRFFLEITGVSGRAVNADVFSADGKLVWSDNNASVSGDYRAEIDLTNVSRGVYLIKVIVDGKLHILRAVTE